MASSLTVHFAVGLAVVFLALAGGAAIFVGAMPLVQRRLMSFLGLAPDPENSSPRSRTEASAKRLIVLGAASMCSAIIVSWVFYALDALF